ncbi:MAG: ribosome maturation factor RimM [Sulfurospirillum sp.]
MKNSDELLQVAKIGRLVGLKGELKLNIYCDFPEQFHKSASFLTDRNFKLEINSFSIKKGLVSFKGYDNREDAQKLVNINLFTTKENSKKDCNLQEGEFFWFEMIGSILKDESKVLGVVEDIKRIGATDYLVIKTDEDLVKQNFPKLFYIPYIDRYILDFDKEEKIIQSKDTFGILENS